MSNILNNVKLGHSPLTDTICVYRHGKDPGLALEKREAEEDVMTVLVQHMMYETEKGSQKDVRVNGKWYNVRVTPSKEK